jgi:hypothetical protein
VTGALAELYLTDEAKKAIAQLLPNEDLAEISTYADEMRSNESEYWQKTATPWHYVTVHRGKTYEQEGAPKEGDAVTALAMFTKQLKDPKTSFADKQLALKFIVHIIGDLHQPFHTGTTEDHGGGTIKLNFLWTDTTLHRLWDEDLIDKQLLSYSEWTNWLCRKITAENVKQWSSTDPKVWIAESVKLRLGLYPKKEKLRWKYQYQNLPIVKSQLQKAGVRIAAYLNAIFSKNNHQN